MFFQNFPLGVTKNVWMKHTWLFTWNLASWEEPRPEIMIVESVFFQKERFFSQQILRNLIPVKLNHLDYTALYIKCPIKTTLSTVKAKNNMELISSAIFLHASCCFVLIFWTVELSSTKKRKHFRTGITDHSHRSVKQNCFGEAVPKWYRPFLRNSPATIFPVYRQKRL